MLWRSKLLRFPFLSISEIWCDTPPLHPGMKISGVALPVYPREEMLNLDCCDGYIKRGNLQIHCQSNGRWTRPDGDCQSNLKYFFCQFPQFCFRNILWPPQSRARCYSAINQLHVRVPFGLHVPPRLRAGLLTPGVRARRLMVTWTRQVLPSSMRSYHHHYHH